eukprot:CAMPEP_0194593414 /NCGR_PEP_ID=MMETSP0292-20121207/23485_1 /TAXON_ID=39354 /ORGANISM="Heterosigma akashiwo, Strain CCMP2393" /LENGTH=34 /DNA_ID= /DNA_START= /DNA_END= /DNA_ORIENTATION=
MAANQSNAPSVEGVHHASPGNLSRFEADKSQVCP